MRICGCVSVNCSVLYSLWCSRTLLVILTSLFSRGWWTSEGQPPIILFTQMREAIPPLHTSLALLLFLSFFVINLLAASSCVYLLTVRAAMYILCNSKGDFTDIHNIFPPPKKHKAFIQPVCNFWLALIFTSTFIWKVEGEKPSLQVTMKLNGHCNQNGIHPKI